MLILTNLIQVRDPVLVEISLWINSVCTTLTQVELMMSLFLLAACVSEQGLNGSDTEDIWTCAALKWSSL